MVSDHRYRPGTSATKLRGEHYKSVLQKTALFQIAKKSCYGLVKDASVHIVLFL